MGDVCSRGRWSFWSEADGSHNRGKSVRVTTLDEDSPVDTLEMFARSVAAP